MVSSKLVLITAAVFAGTGVSIQQYVESSASATCAPAAIERRVETPYGPSLLPLTEIPAPCSSERVSKVRATSKRAKPSRKAAVVKGCSERVQESEVAPTKLEPAHATIQMFESYL